MFFSLSRIHSCLIHIWHLHIFIINVLNNIKAVCLKGRPQGHPVNNNNNMLRDSLAIQTIFDMNVSNCLQNNTVNLK